MKSSNTKLKKRQNKFTKYSLALAAATSLFFGHQKSLAQDREYKPSYTPTRITSSNNYKMTFNDYMNNRESAGVYRILGLGVDAPELPQQYRQGYFHQVVPLTTGNKFADYGKATLDTAKIPITQLSLNLQNAAGKKIEYWTHSWHASALLNAIRTNQIPSERISKIVLLDPPGAYRDYSDIEKMGIKVETYAAEKNWFKALPETFVEKNKGIRGEPLPGITGGVKWTIPFGAGKSNVNTIPTDHYLKNMFNDLSKKGILTPLSAPNNINASLSRSLSQPTQLNLERAITRPIAIPPQVSINQQMFKPLDIPVFTPSYRNNNWNDFGNRGNFVGGYMQPPQIYTQPRIYTQPIIQPPQIYTPTRVERYTPPPRIETYSHPRR